MHRATLFGLLLVLGANGTVLAEQQGATAAPSRSLIEEVVVTAQKREENINDIGMSVDQASGERLQDLGITETDDLFKVVSGFNSNTTYYGTSIYTIRGVGFQDTALASGPTVSVYIDEMPVQFSAMTQGLILDLQRVEALKGPQGTLFGQNATGGAVNYIANKPTDSFEAGVDSSYGRFGTFDVSGFASGPITDTLLGRVAIRTIQGNGWQRSYTRGLNLAPDPYWTKAGRTYKFDKTAGDKNFLTGRATLDWSPTADLEARVTLSGFIDKSDSLRPSLAGIAPLNPVNGLNPLIANYPFAPHDNRAADWGPCVNVSGGSPDLVTGHANLDGTISGEIDPDGNAENLVNRLYDHCKDAAKDNDYWSGTLRLDYDLTGDLTLTSLTAYNKFNRDQRLESDGTIYQDYESRQRGDIRTVFQELRLSGSVRNQGAWVVGVNYEYTKTNDKFLQTYGISTAVPTQVFTRTPLGPTRPNNNQQTKTYALFGNIEYPILDNVTVQAGVRYTNQKRDYRGCGSDGGDGTWADISVEIQQLLQLLNEGVPFADTQGLDAGPGNCASTGPAPTYFPEPAGFTDKLNEDNVSWRFGVSWYFAEDKMAYANVSKGFKSGSFPTVASAAFIQLFPAKQEELLATEIGTKLLLLDGRMQFNASAFYYDYTDKQILGAVPDPIFGSLPALVNVPDSHVWGGEFSLEWYPIDGLRIAPALSYAKSQIDGRFENFDPFFVPGINGVPKNFSGEPFPNAPRWTGNVDVQYERTLRNSWLVFVGANYNYQSTTRGFFYDRCVEPNKPCTKAVYPGLVGDSDLEIPDRGLLDMRGGVEFENWRIWAWARNVTDKYYWNQQQHVNDVLLRFNGMPRTFGVSFAYRTRG